MSLMGRIIGGVLRPLVERQAKGRSFETFATSLERSGTKLSARLQGASDTPRNRETANHIVGIERWGQRRLRAALGEPLVMDSYRGYRLTEGSGLAALRQAFGETRRGTVALARDLAAAPLDTTTKVAHNDLGELSLGGWLAYLDGHASRESLRIRG